jgi:PAS domain S-box-containing protein
MYREVFEKTSDGIFLLDVTSDRRFRIATANPAMERIVGLTIAESEGKFIEEILTPKTAGTVMTYHRRCLETGEPVGFDEELEFPAGRLFLETMLVPVRDEGGRIRRIIGVTRDVTTATLARRALQQSEEKFSKAFHASPDSITISRAEDGVFIDVNHGFEEINGYTREEAIGRSSLPGDLGIWADGDERKRLAELVRTAGEVTGFEATLRRRDGSPRYGVLSSRLVVIDGEQCLLTITRDVTEHKRMEEAIRESEARYREIFENTSDGIFVVEVSPEERFRLLSINPAQEKMLGVTAAETVGKFNDEFLPEDIAKIVNEDNRRCIEAGHPTRFERTLQLPSENRCFSTTLVPVRDAEERIARIIGVTRDISEQKRAQEREKEHERQLFQAAKLASLGTLVSGIAHEINNPNNFIRLNSQNLREFWPDIRSLLDEMDQSGGGIMIHGIPFGAAREMMDDLIYGIEEGSIRIERLLIDLRDFARGDEGELTESVDLNSVIDSAVMITRDLVRKATDSFLVQKAPRLPLVKGNYHQLEQVLINLLTNACQALPLRERGVRVSTLVEEAEGWVVLQVSDEGIGIPISTIPHVTDPFFTTKQAGGGTGLGLAVSSRIVANHGGSMVFDSEVDKGTIATVRLPFVGGKK